MCVITAISACTPHFVDGFCLHILKYKSYSECKLMQCDQDMKKVFKENESGLVYLRHQKLTKLSGF